MPMNFFHYAMKMKKDLLGLKLGDIPGHYQRINVRKLGKDSFAFRVVNPWNKLHLDLVMAPNLNSFKSRLNVHYENFLLKFFPSFMSAR